MLTSKQLEDRMKGIGGSDVAAIFGLSPYKTAFDLYLEKITDSIKVTDEYELNSQTMWGTLLEPVIRDFFERSEKKKVETPTDTIFSERYPWMLANIDGWIEDEKAVLEIKTAAHNYKDWGVENTDNIPTAYLLQCAHYAIVTNASLVYIYASINGNWPKVYIYKRNEELEENLIRMESKFWHQHVLKKCPPPPVEFSDFNHIYLSTGEKCLTADDNLKEIIHNLHDVKSSIKEMRGREEKLKMKLGHRMKENTILLNEDGEIQATWKLTKTNRFSIDRFKKEEPELYKEYLRETTYRRLIIK